MKKIYFCIFIGLLLISNTVNCYGLSDGIRLKKIQRYSEKNIEEYIDLEPLIKDFCAKDFYKEGGIKYFINRDNLSDWRIEHCFRSKDVLRYEPIPIMEGEKVNTGEYIYDEFYLIDKENFYTKLTIIITTDGKFVTPWDKNYSINEYVSKEINYWQNIKNITSHKYEGKTVFIQRVFDRLIKVKHLSFYEVYSFEWYPWLTWYHYIIPVFSSLSKPTIKNYKAYLYSDNYLIIISGISSPDLKTRQEKIMKILISIKIE